ncbi:MAG: hypothetical protein ACTSYO_05845, partial [Candidatus Ranarchaeia archaeon]
MSLDPGLKIAKGGYIEDRLRTLLNGMPIKEFLTSGREEDVSLLKNYRLIEQYDDYLETTHHGKNVIGFLDTLEAFDREKAVPLSAFLYTAIVAKVDIDFLRLQEILSNDMIEQIGETNIDGFQGVLFSMENNLKV